MVTATTSQVTSCAPQSNSCTTVVGSQSGGSEADNTVVTSTKASSTLPASIASGTKESTNQSSKVCFNTNSLAENKSESKATHHNSGKTVTNNKPPSNINNSANKSEKKAQQISHSNNSKPEVSVESGTTKADVKVNSSSAVIPTRTTITHPVSNAPVMMQQKNWGFNQHNHMYHAGETSDCQLFDNFQYSPPASAASSHGSTSTWGRHYPLLWGDFPSSHWQLALALPH